MDAEDYFSPFRKKIIGQNQSFTTPFGPQRILYADWTASGRGYEPIESRMRDEILPFFANTHTTSTITGETMSTAYEEAKTLVKEHVNANEDDVLIFCGNGMTAAVNKLQRIMGLRLPERFMDYVKCPAGRGGKTAGFGDPYGASQQPHQLVRDDCDGRDHPAGGGREC